mmetsp:Transcript_10241/g.21692  ORF Transcript_10241/g.21692 Transcript_10241/m.21692 type:complete len:560 (-) Transcript_10241:58-1737(-)
MEGSSLPSWSRDVSPPESARQEPLRAARRTDAWSRRPSEDLPDLPGVPAEYPQSPKSHGSSAHEFMAKSTLSRSRSEGQDASNGAGAASPDQDAQLLDRLKGQDLSVKELQKELARKSRGKDGPVPWTQSNHFTLAVGIIILMNALVMGLEPDFGYDNKTLFTVFEHFFATVFVVELLLHFSVGGARLYFSEKSNWLDFLLVVLSVADTWVIQQVSGDADMKFVSLLRLLRLSRLARLVRLFRIFKELTLIVAGFLGAVRALFWAMLFLFGTVYIFALLARILIGSKYECPGGPEVQEYETCPAGDDPEFLYKMINEDVGTQKSLFGSLNLSMLSLFMCLTEGCGLDVVHPTVRKSPYLAVFWLLFVLTTTFGVLNLVIGLFCENTFKVAKDAEREIMQSHDEVRQERLKALRKAFEDMDDDGSGSITREEFFQAMTENEDVMASMTALGLDEETDLFDSLDADKSGSLEFNEFFEGVTLILKGQEPALAKDMVATYLRVSALCKAHAQFQEEVQREMGEQAEFEKAFTDSLLRIERLVNESELEGAVDLETPSRHGLS